MEYRRTLFDRFGPRAADYFNAFRGAFIAAGLFGVYGGARYAVEHDFNPIVGGLLGFVIVFLISWLGIVGVSAVAGRSFSAFIQPQGTYEETFSYEDSLLARGHYAAAIAAFEKHIAQGTGGVAVLIRTADLHAKHDNPKRAAELYKQAQQRSDIPAESHMYATNRLIDLYMGPLSSADAAVSELRRLIAMHPSSDAARHARAALVDLKRQLRSESAE